MKDTGSSHVTLRIHLMHSIPTFDTLSLSLDYALIASIYITQHIHKLYSTLGHLDPCVSLVTTTFIPHAHVRKYTHIYVRDQYT